MLNKIIGTLLALSVMSLATADDTRIAKSAELQTTQVASTTLVAETSLIAGRSLQNHLGLGFAHGSGKTIGNSRASASDPGVIIFDPPDLGSNNPYRKCWGNGYLFPLIGGGNHFHIGIGHGNGNWEGFRDCGKGTNVSPS